MALTAGTRLGPYEIVAPLGAGGMGEVYRARDTRLGREVAVKVLPASLSSNPETRARFEREARTVSSLNHPHICTLFDVGREGDTDFLVMELVEGETLAQRLARGALPTADVVRLARQIADALDRAHRAGVVHRDIKPGNIMLAKSGAKLMDFGLARPTVMARPAENSVTVAQLSQSPTVPLTAEGTIVGTFQYMAPEQLEGKDADARSDLWALGCVLYEMATGRRAFEGRSQASLISAIMSSEPTPISQLAPMVPPMLEQVVKQCLAKDPDDRWHSAGDLKRALEWTEGTSALSALGRDAVPAPRRRPALLRLAAALVAGAVLASAVWLLLAPDGPRPAAAVLDLPTAPGAVLNGEPADVVISPDGRLLVYVGNDSSEAGSLWVRPLDSPNARMIPGTDRARHPIWSPDSRWIAYCTTGENAGLMKVPAEGGAPVRLCDVEWDRGGAWGKHGDILFSPAPTSGILRISENGGPVSAATVLDSTRQETSHRHPTFLADGDHFVYSVLPPTSEGWPLYVGSLRSRAVKKLGVVTSAATWVEPGYLLFDRDGRVVAQRLDARRLELVGDVVPLTETPIRTAEDATRIASGSATGRIAMLRSEPPRPYLQWINRFGVFGARFPLPTGRLIGLHLSNDARRAVMAHLAGHFASRVIRVDLDRGIVSTLTPARAYCYPGGWSPDDRTLAMTITGDGGREEIALLPADGSGPMRVLPTSTLQFKSAGRWSPDGRTIVITQIVPGSDRDLFTIDAEHGGVPQPLSAGAGAQIASSISADGRWVAYHSEETGTPQVFVCRFPDGSGKVQITTAGGSEPHWVREGRELVYLGSNPRGFYSMAFVPGQEPGPDASRLLFQIPQDMRVYGWDVTKDGERFLVLTRDTSGRASSTTVIVDWPALLGS